MSAMRQRRADRRQGRPCPILVVNLIMIIIIIITIGILGPVRGFQPLETIFRPGQYRRNCDGHEQLHQRRHWYRYDSRRYSIDNRLALQPPPQEPIKVAVIGCGAIGGYYGSRLWEAGHNVSFFMRGEHFSHCKVYGFNVTSFRGNIFIPPNEIQIFDDTNDIGPVDWVISAIKSTALDAIPDLLYPLLTPKTRILNIMNGLVEEDLLALLAKRCGKDPDDDFACCAAVYGGMALTCSNRIGPGHVNHSFAGLLSAGVAASSKDTTPHENQAFFEALFEPANVDIMYETSLLRGRWKKNCWNLPFNGISVAMGGVTIDVVVNDPGLRKLAYDVMDEVIAIANADLKRNGECETLYLGDAEKKQMMDLSDTMGCYKTSTMLDLVEKKPMEVRYLFRKPLERAERLHIKSPQLETLVLLIEAYQRLYGLF